MGQGPPWTIIAHECAPRRSTRTLHLASHRSPGRRGPPTWPARTRSQKRAPEDGDLTLGRFGRGRHIILPMSLEWEQVVVVARDPVALGRWWTEALGWVVVNDDPAEFEIRG